MTVSGKDQLQLNLGTIAAEFHGFAQAASNVTPTPLQFFDVAMVALRSVHSIRTLGGIIRKRKLHKDADGIYRGGEVEVSCADAQHWGVTAKYLPSALQELVDGRFVEIVREGRPNGNGHLGVATLVRLKYDERPESKGTYIRNHAAFDGFCVKTGIYMDVPDEFYTVMLPTSELSTIKVVSVILRETIGWQDGYGQRRSKIGLSVKSIADRLRLPVSTVHRGITASIDKFIARIEAGVFDTEAGAKSKASVYSVLYRSDNSPIYYPPQQLDGQSLAKRERDNSFKTRTGGSDGSLSKRERQVFPNSNGKSFQTRTDQVFPNENDMKKHARKQDIKQQQNPSDSSKAEQVGEEEVVVVSLLSLKSVPERLAQRLVRMYGMARVREVVEAVDQQKDLANQGAWIHAALRDGYQFDQASSPDPEELLVEKAREEALERKAAVERERRSLEARYDSYLEGVEAEIRTDALLYQEYLAYTDHRLPEMWRRQVQKAKSQGLDGPSGPTGNIVARERRKHLGAFCLEQDLGEVLEFDLWVAGEGCAVVG